MNTLPRRTFLRTATAAGAVALTGVSAGEPAGSRKIKFGLIGCGWYGLVDAKAALQAGGAEVVGICDVDSEHLSKAAGELEKLQGSRPQGFKLYEELLKMPGLEAVIIATPPQWHALQFIAACERGLDIYCEKPLAYDVREGRAMVDAAQKCGRVIQIGFQRRQAAGFGEARKYIQEGHAGPIICADAQIHYTAGTLDPTPQQPPATLDWDLWCGPGPLIPYSPQVGHKNWRLEKTSGHGHLVDWGIHLIDTARWMLGAGAPRTVSAAGGLYHLKGKITTPDVLTVHFEFEPCPLTWRHRIWGAQELDPETSNGIFFFGEKETVFCTDNKWVVTPRGKDQPRQVHEAKSDAGGLHMAEFLEAVRTRRQPSCSTMEAHLSTTAVKLAMISYDTGAKIAWDAQGEQIPGQSGSRQAAEARLPCAVAAPVRAALTLRQYFPTPNQQPMNANQPLPRRSFLKQAAATAAGFQIVPSHVLGQGRTPAGGKLNIAGIGVGGQGAGDLKAMAGENIVALCDVDWNKAAGTFKTYPDAERFKDYRVMLEKCKGIDAVMIATPDHMHAPITMAALRAGKHVYVEKPMAHTIEECRAMRKLAKETGLVTQMGNNGHAGEGLRLTREWIQAGAIGTVREVHCWSDRPGTFWKQALPRPTDTPPVPADLDWNLFLGAAPERPYHPVYHPRAWRGWYDFGTGALGDMAIHNMDPAFYALDLGPLVAAEAETSGFFAESYPAWQILTLEFAAKGPQPALKIRWYDGGKLPPVPEDIGSGKELSDNGIYFLGDKGTMLCGGWSGAPRLFPEARRKSFELPPKTIPRSIGHHAEWIQACKDGKPAAAAAGFDYSAPFNEALLVGNLATRLQQRIEWDADNMKATNAPAADGLIRKPYRDGFGI